MERAIKTEIDTRTDKRYRGKFVAVVEVSRLPITRATSANQNVTNIIPCEKPEEWPPCLAHKQKLSNRATKPHTHTHAHTHIMVNLHIVIGLHNNPDMD